MLRYVLFYLAIAAMAAPASAHELIGVDGKPTSHRHVERRTDYGEPIQQGHRAQPPGGRPIVIWGPKSPSNYGSTAHRQRAVPSAAQPPATTLRTPAVRTDAARDYGKPPDRKR